jgi:hypothetical protein
MTAAELVAVMADPALTAVERLIVSILLKGTDEGDQSRAEWFLNRLLGKVKDQLEVSQPKPFVVQKASGEQLVLGAAPPKEED